MQQLLRDQSRATADGQQPHPFELHLGQDVRNRSEGDVADQLGARLPVGHPQRLDLRTLLPGKQALTTRFSVPRSLAKGTYTGSIAVVDRAGYSPDMYLSNYRRPADGGYTLGSMVVG